MFSGLQVNPEPRTLKKQNSIALNAETYGEDGRPKPLKLLNAVLGALRAVLRLYSASQDFARVSEICREPSQAVQKEASSRDESEINKQEEQ